MKPLSEEEIQKLLESGAAPRDTNESADLQMYRQVFEALDTAPAYELPDDFSEHMVNIVSKHIIARQNFRFYLLLSAISLLAVSLSFSVIAYVNLPFMVKFFSYLWDVKWIILCVFIFFTLIQVGDQLLKKRLSYHSHLWS